MELLATSEAALTALRLNLNRLLRQAVARDLKLRPDSALTLVESNSCYAALNSRRKAMSRIYSSGTHLIWRCDTKIGEPKRITRRMNASVSARSFHEP